MREFIFRGYILPKAVPVSAHGLHSLRWQLESGAVATLAVEVKDGQLLVRAEADTDDTNLQDDLFIRSWDAAQAVVDIISFARGMSLTVVIETVETEGKRTPIVVRTPELESISDSFDFERSFAAIYEIVIQEPPLFMALNDLITAIGKPNYSPIGCARAIEGIRHLIAGSDARDSSAWQKMREALQIDEAYLKLVTNTSTGPRHGRRIRIDGSVTKEISVRAWTIMNRYIEFRKRGGLLPLPREQFPVLVG